MMNPLPSHPVHRRSLPPFRAHPSPALSLVSNPLNSLHLRLLSTHLSPSLLLSSQLHPKVSSEDPLLNGHFGQFYSQGLQSPIGGDPNHILVISTLKHFDAYSLEDADGFTRHNFNAVVSNYSLATTYLPAFKQSIVVGGALSVMCSYNSVNG